MGILKEKVERLIQKELGGSDVFLEELPQTERLSGHVIWKGFDEMTAIERQRHLRRMLRQMLTPEEEGSLSLLLALTPAEWDGIREEAA